MPPEDEARRLWNEHQSAPFPDRLRGMEIAPQMVMLDADIAGCITTWLGSKRRGSTQGPPRTARPLDEWRRGVLRECVAELDRVLPLLLDGERPYFERLRRLAQLALT